MLTGSQGNSTVKKSVLVSLGPARISGLPAAFYVFFLCNGLLFAQSSVSTIRMGAVILVAFLVGVVVGPNIKIWEKGPFDAAEPLLELNGRIILGRKRKVMDKRVL